MFRIFHLNFRSAHYNNLQKQEEEEEHLKKSNNNNVNENQNPTNTSANHKKGDSALKPQLSGNHSFESSIKPSQPLSLKTTEKGAKQLATSTPFKPNAAQAKTQPRRLPNLQNIVPKHLTSTPPSSNERPLKCLETLAQKAGITFDEPTESYSSSKSTIHPTQAQSFKMDKNQGTAQQVTQAMPIQLSPEQLQQIQQQYQLQQAFAAGGGASIQVKQEFPQQTITAEQLKQQLQDQQNQAHQVQQMQLIDTSASPQHQGIKYVSGKFSDLSQ